mmetsp:Transcript_23014/g.46704  ORF Transcript_23014/g.46704 Transcript_23014/m.46704 type:complete len:96 (+) Transcript_23014:359-646(+)
MWGELRNKEVAIQMEKFRKILLHKSWEIAKCRLEEKNRKHGFQNLNFEKIIFNFGTDTAARPKDHCHKLQNHKELLTLVRDEGADQEFLDSFPPF